MRVWRHDRRLGVDHKKSGWQLVLENANCRRDRGKHTYRQWYPVLTPHANQSHVGVPRVHVLLVRATSSCEVLFELYRQLRCRGEPFAETLPAVGIADRVVDLSDRFANVVVDPRL